MNSGSKNDSAGNRNLVSQRIAFAAVLLAGLFMLLSQASLRSVKAAPDTKTTEDGVYSADQAKHGKDVYTQSCAACHMDDLTGSGEAPALVGDAFTSSWDGHSVDDLDQAVLNTMPLDKPGSLDPNDALAIVTYIFQENKFPAGKDELKNDPATLQSITISDKK